MALALRITIMNLFTAKNYTSIKTRSQVFAGSNDVGGCSLEYVPL